MNLTGEAPLDANPAWRATAGNKRRLCNVERIIDVSIAGCHNMRLRFWHFTSSTFNPDSTSWMIPSTT